MTAPTTVTTPAPPSLDGAIVQIHLLTSYPAALLNRDDAGLAKRMPFGGTVRTRISSQCLKKHWREAMPLHEDDGETTAVRSRLIFERYVADKLRARDVAPAEAATLTQLLIDTVLSKKEKQDKAGDAAGTGGDDGADDGDESADEGTEASKAAQVLVLSQPECDWLTQTALDVHQAARNAGVPLDDAAKLKVALTGKGGPKGAKQSKQSKKGAAESGTEAHATPMAALAALWRDRVAILKQLPASVDVALFGRFVTSDLLARVDTAVSVAHALTTHAELAETDYFTAVDMLDPVGAGHLNDTELTSGVFYTYAVVDLAQLRANLGPHADRAEELVARLVRTMATVGPRAKRGSTAPFALAEFVMLERGTGQPRTLANAFRTAVALPKPDDGDDLMANSIRALLEYRGRLAAMYGEAPNAVVATAHPEVVGGAAPLVSLSAAVTQTIAPTAAPPRLAAATA